ncbi:hypothetical protein Tco_0157022 [Tanacetum coccineum]
MGTKVTSSSGSVLEEPEIQKLQMQAKIFKENSLNKLNALKSTTQLLERQTFSGCILYQQAFAQLFGDSVRTFKFQLSQHMNNLETLLNAETLHEMDSKSALSVIKVQFERFINSDLLKPLDIYSRSFSSDREVRENFRDYTTMTAETFKETIIQNMNSIEQCIIERSSHEQELNSGDETSSGIVSDEEIDKQELEAHYSFMAKIQEGLTFRNQVLLIHIDKTILDSHCFVHELKTEMHDDLEYVKSLEKEVDELESEKADFSNIYDLLLEECVSKDVICSYLHSMSDLNAHTGLQCLYLHKVKECECLAQKLSKQTESVNKEVHNNLLKSFSKLEKHSISLELDLQQCKKQMKNNSVCKENGSNVFRKEREQYHEIQDLKAQMQDKNMVINELKKLILVTKGKSVETQFDKPSVVR